MPFQGRFLEQAMLPTQMLAHNSQYLRPTRGALDALEGIGMPKTDRCCELPKQDKDREQGECRSSKPCRCYFRQVCLRADHDEADGYAFDKFGHEKCDLRVRSQIGGVGATNRANR